jgi:hypothetical protein
MSSVRRTGELAVVLVNGTSGRELSVVHDLLRHSLRVPVILLEPIPLSYDVDGGLLDVGGRRIRPAVVWARHTAPLTLTAHAALGPVPAAAWSGLVAQLASAAPVALPGPAPAGTAQLDAARRLGVATPRTVLSTDAAAAVRGMRAERTVVKTPDFRLADADRGNWPAYVPLIVSSALPADIAPGRAVVVQEYVPHVRELRVFHLDGALAAFEIGKHAPATQWTDPDRVTVRPVACPPAAAHAVRVLSAAWRLRYGAFDLLVRPGGEVVFLEANPDGDWLWYEHRAGRPGLVSFLAAVMVRALFDRTLRQRSPRR